MESNELMIGNIVDSQYWNPNPENPTMAKENCIIHAIGSTTCNVILKGGMIIKLPHKNIFPIPLTPEILVKCGFKENAHGFFELKLSDYHRLAKGQYFQFCTTENGITLPIQYVHQLQNLYMALTGKQLSITL